MQIKQSMLRVAAATTVTMAMTVGFVGPVQATADQGRSEQAQAQRDQRDKGAAKAEQKNGPDHSQGNASTQGDYDQPQPESKADQNDGGANAGDCESGPRHSYCSTRDGSASQNGKGDGEATGKPCAGCVGKADNKNPAGQYPDGSDRNAGYECDRNQGIGQGNPAHTGCTGETEAPTAPTEPKPEPQPEPQPTQPGVTCPEGSTMNEEGDACVLPVVLEPTCPAGATMNEAGDACILPVELDATCPAGATMNDAGDACLLPVEQTGQGGPEVLGAEAERQVPAVAGAEAGVNRAPATVAPVAGILPATGAGAYGLAALAGVGLLAAGGVLLARRRTQLDG